jgi:hypothetical protein
MKKQDFINFIGSWPVIHRNETDLAIVRLFFGKWSLGDESEKIQY